MRVVHIGIASPRQESGGLNRYVADLAREQSRIGVTPLVLALGTGQPAEREFRFVATPGSPILTRLLAFRRAMTGTDIGDAVLDVHFAWNAVAGLLGRRRRAPVVVHFHGPWAAEAASDGARSLVTAAKRLVERWVYRRADGCIVLTEAFRTLLVSTYGVRPDRVAVIPPGVDTRRFAPADKQAARARLGLPHQGAIVVAVRRLVPRMGLADLIAAIRDIDTTLVIVGRGPLIGPLREQTELQGMSDRVVFRQEVGDDELPDYYRAADLSVVPTRELEGFGLVALESLACGTPVVARAQGGLVDALRSFDARALVPDMSVEALAERIAAHLLSPIPPEDCLAFARHFDWAEVAARTGAYYESIGGRP